MIIRIEYIPPTAMIARIGNGQTHRALGETSLTASILYCGLKKMNLSVSWTSGLAMLSA